MSHEPKPHEQLFQLCLGYLAPICLNVVTHLSVADEIAHGPKHVDEIARATSVNSDALYRVLRAVSTVGVFQEVEPRRFAQTPMSDLLRRDHPQSVRPFVLFFPDPLHFRCYSNLMHSVRTGETTAKPTLGKELFEYLREHPEESEIFNAAMVNVTQMFIPPVLEAYDFSGTRTLVDIGGGHGSVVGAILKKYPHMKGILFDLDHVVEGASAHLKAEGVADRCEIQSGDFFKAVPAGGDTYIMKNIIHDWDDERSINILKNIASRLKGNPLGKVVLLEFALSSGSEPQVGKWADIEMLALPGGRERTEQEYRELFKRSGLRLTRVVPTQAPQSVIEAVLD
jgi:O-methyltransferase domain